MKSKTISESLKEILFKTNKLSNRAAAEKLGISQQYLSDYLNGNKRLSVNMALRLEKSFDLSAEILLKRQVEEDLLKVRGF